MNKLEVFSVTNTQYHRNGTGGIGFYSAIIAWKDSDGVCPNMLVTFEAEGVKVDTTTCRVVSLDSPTLCWRGDVIADALTSFFKKNKIKDLYLYMKTLE